MDIWKMIFLSKLSEIAFEACQLCSELCFIIKQQIKFYENSPFEDFDFQTIN